MWRHIFPLCWNRSRRPVSYPVFLLSMLLERRVSIFCLSLGPFFLSRWLQCSSGVAKKLPKIQKVASEISEYFYLVYTKTVNSVFRALWLPTQSVNILHYSLIHLQFLRASDVKLAWVASKMPSRFAAVTNKEISQLIKQAAPEIHEEGDKVRFRSFNR